MQIALTCLCLTFLPASVSAQWGMNKGEAAQLYSATGFPMRNDQPVNRCGKPAKPRVTFVDRWNGREYKVQRWEYEGKAGKPPR